MPSGMMSGACADSKDPDQLVKPYEPALDKNYNKTCVTSKDSDQPVDPPSEARVFVHPSLDGPEAVEGTCDWQRL